ncbi:MAG: O-methyltransferase [Deltaproteobacteria bacterium]|nr:O-methyltransferase [Deltaproteobacteria bacterium]MBW2071207.1 O-methyltransferase [Deltaproteobacteria bacterium]
MTKTLGQLQKYFSQFVPDRDALLGQLEEEAGQQGIPIIGPVMGELLAILVCSTGARAIVELGTATGYSAIYLAKACRSYGGQVLTIERDPAMAARAEANFEAAGLTDSVEVKVGEASNIMAGLAPSFDLVFMDIDKQDYAEVLPHCHRLLRPGGLLIADNVSFEGARGFNETISSQNQWRAVHLLCFLPGHSPENDGISLAIRVE